MAAGMWRIQAIEEIGAVLSIAAFALLLLPGCGPRTDRLAISGKVTLDGVPLDSGSIRFSSLEGQKLLASGAMVQNGQYHVPQDKGLTPGTYRVEITSPDLDAPQVMVRDTPGGPGIPAAPNRIPPEYNIKSQQTIEVTNDRDNHFVFEVVSKSAK